MLYSYICSCLATLVPRFSIKGYFQAKETIKFVVDVYNYVSMCVCVCVHIANSWSVLRTFDYHCSMLFHI